MKTIQAVVFDWAGTTIDFGSFAPMAVFVKLFAQSGTEVSIEQARQPMGLPKRDHIAAMLANPDISRKWQQTHGHPPGQPDIDRLYEAFVPMNEAVAADYAELIPGTVETVQWLRDKQIRIGSTTGYTRSIMQRVVPVAARQGYRPDNLVCADDLPEGRPGPLGMYQCFIDLRVYPPHSVIKVDDTAPGILEGRSAGCVTVGVAMSGNTVGRTPEDLAQLAPAAVQSLRRRAGDILRQAGADYVIDTVADLPAVIEQIDRNRGTAPVAPPRPG